MEQPMSLALSLGIAQAPLDKIASHTTWRNPHVAKSHTPQKVSNFYKYCLAGSSSLPNTTCSNGHCPYSYCLAESSSPPSATRSMPPVFVAIT